MTSSQPPFRPPWQTRQLSYGAKLLAIFGFLLLLLFGLGAIGAGLFVLFTPNSSSGNWLAGVPDLLGFLVFGVACLFGAVKLYPLISAPTNFTPRYGVVSPDTLGHPFEVRYQWAGLGRSLSGKSVVRFEPEALVVEDYLTPGLPFLIGGFVLLPAGTMAQPLAPRAEAAPAPATAVAAPPAREMSWALRPVPPGGAQECALLPPLRRDAGRVGASAILRLAHLRRGSAPSVGRGLLPRQPAGEKRLHRVRALEQHEVVAVDDVRGCAAARG